MGALALVAASGAFIFAYDFFTQTRHFQARQIVVSGMQRLSRQEVMALAGVELQTNILSVNLATTRKRLLADPWIAEATVSREIPSGLHIDIREEVPLALLDMGDGQGFLINAAGKVFKREDGSESSAMPRVEGLDHSDLPVSGQPASEAFRAVMTLLRLAGEKSNPLSLSGIRRIHMDREIGATLFSGDDERTVKLGFGHYQEKMEALGRLKITPEQGQPAGPVPVIDLFDVNRIVMTPAPVDPRPRSDRKEV